MNEPKGSKFLWKTIITIIYPLLSLDILNK